VVPGESLVYTIVATNNGPSDATLVMVTDDIPDGIQVTSVTTTAGTANIPASAQDTIAANPDDITVDIGDLAAGDTATITVNATVLPATRGTLTNEATVSTDDTSAIETDPTNNTATETTDLNPVVDLVVTKTDSIDPVIAGNELTYTMVVTNNGPSTATDVDFSDTLPAGVAFTSATSTQGDTPAESNGIVTANLGTLDPSASATVTIVVDVDPDTRGTIVNTATVTPTETEDDSTNNSASASTTVDANVDLSITKVGDTDRVTAGGDLTYTLVVSNDGPSSATGVTVTDTLPDSLSFDSGSSTVGTVTNDGNEVTVDIGTLAPGGTAEITLNTSVLVTASGTISNTATVSGTETDTDPANDSATESTEAVQVASIGGTSYVDNNRNGVFDEGDNGLEGVTIRIVGIDSSGNAVDQTVTTDANGNYVFSDLNPGRYDLLHTQPAGFSRGQANVGEGATGTPPPAGEGEPGTAGPNEINGIDLASGDEATGYNFGVLQFLSKRLLLASTP
jgi:uncharacterized repeat protein (TIGR01451 family)